MVGVGLGGVTFVVGLLFVIGADWVPRWIGFVLLLVLFGFTVWVLIGFMGCVLVVLVMGWLSVG